VGRAAAAPAITDFKLVFDIELGFGYGLTSGSDRLIAKAIIGYDFPVPGATNHTSDSGLKVPLTMKAPPRQTAGNILNDSASGSAESLARDVSYRSNPVL
jgi:hypothetical protein